MLLDIRVRTELPRHRKFKKLKRLIGDGAMEHLITFWCNVAEQIPNGALNGWSNDDISDAACWCGDPSEFVSAMVESGFIDTVDDGFVPHDWAENQPWVVEAKERSENARKAGKASAAARLAKYGTSQPPNGCSNDCSEGVRTAPERLPNPRTPSPSPTLLVNNTPLTPQGEMPVKPKRKIQYPESFELWWGHYPKKVGKEAALKEWKKIAKRGDVTVKQLIDAIDQQVENNHFLGKNGGDYTPDPERWFKKGRWMDEITYCHKPKIVSCPLPE